MAEAKKIKVKKEEEKKENSREIALRHFYPFSLSQSMDHYFNKMWRRFENLMAPIKVWQDEPIFRIPLANITENNNTFSISLELPGMEKDNIQINLIEDRLEIKGEKKEEREEKAGSYIRKEYSTSTYHRVFKIPENTTEADLDATYDNGVLKIVLTKKKLEDKEAKSIEIK